MDQGGSAQDLDLGGGSGGPGHGTPQAFNSAVELPRAAQLATSAWAVGSVEDLGMNASTLERIRFAAANRLCVDVGYEGGRAKGGAILTAQGSRRQCCAICLRGRLLRMCYLSNWRHFGG